MVTRDLRFEKTENSLQEALLTLLASKKLSKISVKELCELAQVSRNAFYQHYETKEHLYEAIILDIVLDIEESCRPVVDKFSDIGPKENQLYMNNVLAAVDHHRPRLKKLLENEQTNFSKQLQKILVDAMISNAEKFNHPISPERIHYLAGGLSAFIIYWMTQTTYGLEEAKDKLFDSILPNH